MGQSWYTVCHFTIVAHLVRVQVLLLGFGSLLADLLGRLSRSLLGLGGLLLASLLASLELGLGDLLAGDLVKVKVGDGGGSLTWALLDGGFLVISHGDSFLYQMR